MLNKKELANELSISESMVNKLLTQGIPRVYIGKSVRFELDDVLDWVKSRSENK